MPKPNAFLYRFPLPGHISGLSLTSSKIRDAWWAKLSPACYLLLLRCEAAEGGNVNHKSRVETLWATLTDQRVPERKAIR